MSKFIRDTQLESYSNERDDYQPKQKKVKKFKDKEEKSYKKK